MLAELISRQKTNQQLEFRSARCQIILGTDVNIPALVQWRIGESLPESGKDFDAPMSYATIYSAAKTSNVSRRCRDEGLF